MRLKKKKRKNIIYNENTKTIEIKNDTQDEHFSDALQEGQVP